MSLETGDRTSSSRTVPSPFKRWFAEATVQSVTAISPRMRSIALVGPQLRNLQWRPGQQIRVVLGDLSRLRTWITREVRDAARTYSLAGYDPVEGRYELIVVDHEGDGPGARWGRSVQAGDPVVVGHPEGSFVVKSTDRNVLLVGEETAAVAFSAMIDAIPQGCTARVVVEAETEGDHLLPAYPGLIQRVHRAGSGPSPSRPLVDAVRRLSLPDVPFAAYLAGEAKTIQQVRRHLIVDRDWTRRQIHTKPFWTPGKRGLD